MAVVETIVAAGTVLGINHEKKNYGVLVVWICKSTQKRFWKRFPLLGEKVFLFVKFFAIFFHVLTNFHTKWNLSFVRLSILSLPIHMIDYLSGHSIGTVKYAGLESPGDIWV